MSDAPERRVCGNCSLCCKLFKIPELDKRNGQWCRHCIPGQGCTIYAERPAICKNFVCQWLHNPNDFGTEWFPKRAHIVVAFTGDALRFHVDPKSPGRWRESPYFEKITALASAGVPVEICVGESTFCLSTTPPPSDFKGPVETFVVNESETGGDA